jgi:hypothetical protein
MIATEVGLGGSDALVAHEILNAYSQKINWLRQTLARGGSAGSGVRWRPAGSDVGSGLLDFGGSMEATTG